MAGFNSVSIDPKRSGKAWQVAISSPIWSSSWCRSPPRSLDVNHHPHLALGALSSRFTNGDWVRGAVYRIGNNVAVALIRAVG